MDRLDLYFDVQEVPEKKKVKTFVALLPPKLFQLLKNLLYPETFDKKTFAQLKEILQKHVSPKPLIQTSRHTFINRKQKEGETITHYLSELRKLIVPCQYSEVIFNELLRDIFVAGIRSSAILNRLFEHEPQPLDKTFTIALSVEKASEGAVEMLQPNRKDAATINKVRVQPKKNTNGTQFDTKQSGKQKTDSLQKKEQTAEQPSEGKKTVKCNKYGYTNHLTRDCKRTDLKCTYCSRDGHLEAVCFGKKKGI